MEASDYPVRNTRRTARLARLAEIRETGKAVAPAIIAAHEARPIEIKEMRAV
jgi:hypothetical protein